MSFLRRIFERLRRPTYLVGRDFEGNRYYEYPSVSNESMRTKRVVKYRPGADMLTYVAGKRRLPVQWTSWLTHTRAHPPALEELYADQERQRRVLENAALIEARDREERALQQQIAASNQGSPNGALNTPTEYIAKQEDAASPVQPVGLPPTSDSLAKGTTAPQQAPPVGFAMRERAAPVSDEPQSWSPRTIRRG